jgi:predicted peptidase
VDPKRIYFVGSSCGGYAALRLAELLPDLPACVVPIAGYYPENLAADHNIQTMAQRIKDVPIWAMHCKQDRICTYDRVCDMYNILRKSGNANVQWVDEDTSMPSKSWGKNFHTACKHLRTYPDAFVKKLLGHSKSEPVNVVEYLCQMHAETMNKLIVSRRCHVNDESVSI